MRLEIPSTKIATTNTATPEASNRSGCRPAPFHSPVPTPHSVAVITISDMNRGQPSTGPNAPNLVAPTPYITVLPNQKKAMMAASP